MVISRMCTSIFLTHIQIVFYDVFYLLLTLTVTLTQCFSISGSRLHVGTPGIKIGSPEMSSNGLKKSLIKMMFCLLWWSVSSHSPEPQSLVSLVSPSAPSVFIYTPLSLTQVLLWLWCFHVARTHKEKKKKSQHNILYDIVCFFYFNLKREWIKKQDSIN